MGSLLGSNMASASTVSSKGKSINHYSRRIAYTNMPSALTYIIGTIIMFHLGILYGVLFLIFLAVELVLFMRFACAYCSLHGSVHCPSGYGLVAARIFRRGDVSKFPRMFKTFVPFFSIVWVIPLLGALYLLSTDFSLYYLVLTVVFVAIGFVVLPVFHKYRECRDCPNRKNCPWGH
jgi:hypothetical protein